MVKVNSNWIIDQNVKGKKYKISRRKSLRPSGRQRFLKQEAKSINNKEKMLNLTSSKLKSCALGKTPLRK